MQGVIKYKIETLSNLFIGGAPAPFEIGGIDQYTVVDHEGFPYIPASSLKGALRAIACKDEGSAAKEIAQLYDCYLDREKQANWERIQNLIDKEALVRIEERYDSARECTNAGYLFGIESFNNTPKLLFGDGLLSKGQRDKKTCFSIDMKNSIDAKGDAPVSNPRTYKTAMRGLTFEGEIRFYRMELLGEGAQALCEAYLAHVFKQFDEGMCRLGNSKSRGYGKVKITLEEKDEGGRHDNV